MSRLKSCIALFLLSLLAMVAGCAERGPAVILPKGTPVIRVRLMQDCDQVVIGASDRVWAKSGQDMTASVVNFPSVGSVVRLYNGYWIAGTNTNLGSGELTLTPNREGAITVQGQQYRGRYRLVPVSSTTFDVVNDVAVDGYLKSVISKELYPGWQEETYKAQAIVARTYALYESRSNGVKRYWDVWGDTRSQEYGGIAAETSKSIRAVDATAGVVVAAGTRGQERIFKAYFSACCGGKSQSAYDAFGDDYSKVLSERNGRTWCRIAPKYTWDGVTIRKEELARRIVAWAKRKSTPQAMRPEVNLAGVYRIDPAYVNQTTGRPCYFQITDTRGRRYMLRSEDMRLAINTDVPKGGSLVWSSNFRTDNSGDVVRFYDGHGYGHGVGMCQWCAQGQALAGWRHEDIVIDAYPGAKLIRAY